jgi:hypothetical protein
MIFGREPAVFLSGVGALVTLALALGLKLTDIQLAGINTAVVAIVAFCVRQSVTGPPELPKAPTLPAKK